MLCFVLINSVLLNIFMCFFVVDFCWAISRGVLLGHIPWILVGMPCHMDFCWEAIAHCKFVVGPYPMDFCWRPCHMDFCWEAIAHCKFVVGPYPMDFCLAISLEFLLEALYHAFLLGGHGPCSLIVELSHAFLLGGPDPCIFIVGPYPMYFCWKVIAHAHLLWGHIPCIFVGIIAHAHLMWDQIPCIFVGRPCPERKFSVRLFPMQLS